MRMITGYVKYRQGCGSGYAKESSPGHGRNCRLLLSEEVKESAWCFAKEFAFVPFPYSLFSCLYWTGLAVLSVIGKARFFWACWKHLNVFAATGSVALWWYSEFGVTLDWLFLIKNEISSIWVQANNQWRRTYVTLQAWVLTMNTIWKKHTWTTRCCWKTKWRNVWNGEKEKLEI